jgi:hypothetical protein
MDYSPIFYNNVEAGTIFNQMLFANNTVAKGYVRVEDKIKSKRVVTSISGTLTPQPYSTNPTLPTTSALKAGDSTIEPVKWQIIEPVSMDVLRATRFGLDMKAGAANTQSASFDAVAKAWAVESMGDTIEKQFWGLVDTKLAAASHISLAATTLTASNLVTELTKVYLAIPGEVVEKGKAVIYAPRSVKPLAMVVNQDTTKYKNAFVIVGDSVQFMGVDILFVPLAENTLIAGNKEEVILGTDLVTDFGAFEIGKVNNYGDDMFMKSVYALDAAVVFANKKVLYKVTSGS